MPVTALQTQFDKKNPNVRRVASHPTVKNSYGFLEGLRGTCLGKFYRAHCKKVPLLHSVVQWGWRTFFPVFYN